MNKTIIGGIFIFIGTMITLSIFLLTVIALPDVYSWSGSKFWYTLFGSLDPYVDTSLSLSLGFPFIVGIIMFTMGLAILLFEYFRQEDIKEDVKEDINNTSSET